MGTHRSRCAHREPAHHRLRPPKRHPAPTHHRRPYRDPRDHRPRPPTCEAATADEHARLVAEIKQAATDWTAAEITDDGVTFTAGIGGTAPLYFATGRHELAVTWDARQAVNLARRDQIGELETARRLTLTLRYSHATMWQNVRMLTERSTAVWDGNWLALTYPEAAAR